MGIFDRRVDLTPTFNEVESLEFDAGVAVMSGLTGIQVVLEHNPLVTTLMMESQRSKSALKQITDRITFCLNAAFPAGFRNPYDYSIMTYLYAVYNVDNALGVAVARDIIGCGSLKWAYRYAVLVLDNDTLPMG